MDAAPRAKNPWLSLADTDIVPQVAQRAARIEVKLRAQVVVPITVAVAAVDERGSNRHNASGHGDHHNQIHIEEVIDNKKTIIVSSLSSRTGWSNR